MFEYLLIQVEMIWRYRQYNLLVSQLVSSVVQSCPTFCNQPDSSGLQHARPPCPSPTPGACSNSCPLSRWCHPTISSYVVPFSSAFNLSQHLRLKIVLRCKGSWYWWEPCSSEWRLLSQPPLVSLATQFHISCSACGYDSEVGQDENLKQICLIDWLFFSPRPWV